MLRSGRQWKLRWLPRAFFFSTLGEFVFNAIDRFTAATVSKSAYGHGTEQNSCEDRGS